MQSAELIEYSDYSKAKFTIHSFESCSCSIIVMPANDVMKSLHECMPAIIIPAHQDLWLYPRVTDKVKIMGYLNSAPSGQLVTFAISPCVNSPKHDDEQCIEPAGDM